MWLRKTVAAIIPLSKESDYLFDVVQDLDATSYIDEILIVGRFENIKYFKRIQKTRAKIIKVSRDSIGYALKRGIRSTKADLIIITQSDGAFQAKDISKLLSYSEDFDTVFASRTHTPLIEKNSGMTFSRRLVDDLFGKMISILFLSSNLTDVGCTLRLTNRKGWRRVAKECDSSSDIFLTQWLIAAAKKKLRFIEIPVNYTASGSPGNKESFMFLSGRAILIFYLIVKAWLLDFLKSS